VKRSKEEENKKKCKKRQERIKRERRENVWFLFNDAFGTENL
jgi:hypothetical protein